MEWWRNEGIEQCCDGGMEWASEWAPNLYWIPLSSVAGEGVSTYSAIHAHLHIC